MSGSRSTALLTATARDWAPGEAPARIESLKDELRGLGAVFRWDGASYVLVDTVSAGEGYQVEDV